MTDCYKCPNRNLHHCRPCPVMQGLMQAAATRREIDREMARKRIQTAERTASR